ncbi:DUF2997 domain-containing protein [Bremerella sp. T1]|uniref:DUF2997 domain-containing protein n=1 Tax=Bremerella alba TaxID=980252 RepID=A0A7V9A8J4_9BACT|nr:MULTISPECIES: DUF2997 domain-containing protein [Bremerella]MBA2116106.1 hypothetical protein [Bremerella alba]UBM36342.1 DUF2997 domain-containing protein [Bremerella volcania]
MKVIEIIVSPEGESKLETRGFQGAECQEASRFLELALGRKTSDTATSEFHQTSVQQQTQLEQKE